MKKNPAFIMVIILFCAMLAACAPSEDSQTPKPPSTYTKEQLQALGKVMVCGDYICIEEQDVTAPKNVQPMLVGTITFVDSAQRFAAMGHNSGDTISNDQIYDVAVSDVTRDAIALNFNGLQKTIARLDDYFGTEDGLFGKLGDFTYNSAAEVGFALPESGEAKIYLEMPNDNSGWYTIEIDLIVLEAEATTHRDFSFHYSDSRLPSDFQLWESDGRSGSPIVQNNHLVGAFSSTAKNDDESKGILIANLAADMRFALLQKYDKDFDAELFRGVSTLKDYFD